MEHTSSQTETVVATPVAVVIPGQKSPQKPKSHCSKMSSEIALAVVENGDVWTTSVIIAEKFGKIHRNVMRAIDDLVDNGMSMTFFLKNFVEVNHVTDRGRAIRAYRLTKAGFIFVVTGFTGAEASLWKEQFISTFERMEKAIKAHWFEQQTVAWRAARAEGKVIRKEETDAIKAFIPYAKGQGSKGADTYYFHFTRMPYLALLDVDASDLKGIKDKCSERQLRDLTTAEQMISDMIIDGILAEEPYKTIFANARDKVAAFAALCGPKLPPGQYVDRPQLPGSEHLPTVN
jgi:Rha family phage regulatory protein